MSRGLNAIKVLTDFEKFGSPVSIDMQVLTDLKRTLIFMQSIGSAGDRPPRYGKAATLVRDLAIPNYSSG